MAIEVGDPAPDFSLTGWHAGEQREYSLAAAAGSPLVLVFYPYDDSLTCTKQLCSYSDNLGAFAALGATVWGISAQDLDSHRRFATKRGLDIPLLADPQREAVKAYGVDGVLGRVKRSVFLVDAAGRLAWKDVSTLGLGYQSVEDISRELRRLPA